MDERTTGVVLRTRPLTETSLIVHWLTQDCGRVATVAKGARRPQSPFRGKLDLLFQAQLSFQRSRRSHLHTLREINLLQTFPPLRADPDRLRRAAYAVALIEKSVETDTPVPDLYQLLVEFLDHLARLPLHPCSVLSLECRFFAASGLDPLSWPGRLTPGAQALLQKTATLPWDQLLILKPTLPQLRELEHHLQSLLLDHLGFLPSSRSRALRPSDPSPPA